MYDDDDFGAGGGGCLTILIVGAVITWLSDNWQTILLVVLLIIAVVAVIALIKSYEAKAPVREAQARAAAEKAAAEKREKERESYDRYFEAQNGAALKGRLDEANEIVRRLFSEDDEERRVRVLEFLDKYLPLVTEIIEASKHGATDIDESLERFTETVKAFSKSLYKVDDVVDMNKTMMENMAIRDGYYDPYAEAFRLDAEEDTQIDNTEIRPERKSAMTAADIEMAMQDRLDEAILFDDFDTIRDMLDSGVISEYDIDEDVLSKVEEYI